MSQVLFLTRRWGGTRNVFSACSSASPRLRVRFGYRWSETGPRKRYNVQIQRGDSPVLMKTSIIYSLLLAFAIPAARPADPPPLRGYSAESARAEREWEAKFRAIPDPVKLRANVQRLSARPHHVGSPYDKDNAEWILARFKEWGLDARIEIFDVLFPTPKERLLEMIEPSRVVAKIAEPAVPGDPTSAQQEEQLPSYNAYSIDGDVTAPLVYVNYGIPADYEELDRLGISVKGAIVIARYGASWRGIKPKVAGEHGAIGCLIYSDPRDDGYQGGPTFPDGP